MNIKELIILAALAAVPNMVFAEDNFATDGSEGCGLGTKSCVDEHDADPSTAPGYHTPSFVEIDKNEYGNVGEPDGTDAPEITVPITAAPEAPTEEVVKEEAVKKAVKDLKPLRVIPENEAPTRVPNSISSAPEGTSNGGYGGVNQLDPGGRINPNVIYDHVPNPNDGGGGGSSCGWKNDAICSLV